MGSATDLCVSKGANSTAKKMRRVCLATLAMGGLALVACDAGEHFTKPMTLGGREVPAETLQAGHDLYVRYCVSCHGEDGSGAGPAARNLEFSPRDFRTAEYSFVEGSVLPTHEALVEAIRVGVPKHGMPAWQGMRDDDLSALADYIKTFSPRWKVDPS